MGKKNKQMDLGRNEEIDLNIKDDQGFTALMRAAGFGDASKVKELIDCGADIDIQDDDGWTALMQAANERQLSTLGILLKAGANVSIKDCFGKTAMDYAIDKKRTKVVEALTNVGNKKKIQLSPGQKVPKSGIYKCTFCGENSISQVMAMILTATKTKVPELLKEKQKLSDLQGKETQKYFKKGKIFPECPNCTKAKFGRVSAWCFEEEISLVTRLLENNVISFIVFILLLLLFYIILF